MRKRRKIKEWNKRKEKWKRIEIIEWFCVFVSMISHTINKFCCVFSVFQLPKVVWISIKWFNRKMRILFPFYLVLLRFRVLTSLEFHGFCCCCLFNILYYCLSKAKVQSPRPKPKHMLSKLLSKTVSKWSWNKLSPKSF